MPSYKLLALEKLLANTQTPPPIPDWIRAEMAAIPRDRVIAVNLDTAAVIAKVFGVTEAIKPYREQMACCSHVDQTAADKLGVYMEALHELDLRCRALHPPQAIIAELRKEGIRFARDLRAEVQFLVAGGLIPARILKTCSPRRFGFKDVATKIGVFVSVLELHWAQVEGRCGVTREDLGRANQISRALLGVVARRRMSKDEKAQAAALRDRAFTLLVRCYDQVSKAIAILRWETGDADKIVPSLYSGRKRRAAKGKKAGRDRGPVCFRFR